MFHFAKRIRTISNKIYGQKKLKQNGTRLEIFDVWFCISFDQYCQNLHFGRKGETGN